MLALGRGQSEVKQWIKLKDGRILQQLGPEEDGK